ncbi:hypothetical protein CHS0354_013523 [Potamilus streckersoni]|uniref:Uncharacterized protein n=1 Tax=Potamilus streckersoni TaxID=2493646 RepID=A0AAE0T8H1_9BIVA|nr:hypothetical protein CHS0354_013523 [Potamilus streckersoni]
MRSLEILTGKCVLFLFQIALSHNAADGCASFACPRWGGPVCSLYTEPSYKAVIISRNDRCVDRDESHEDHGWRHKRGGYNHGSDSNHGSDDGVFYTVSYNNIIKMLTIKVWNGCKITLQVCQVTPTTSTSKPKSTRRPFPPTIPSPGYPPSTEPPQRAISTIKPPQITSTNGRPTAVVLTTERPQEATSTTKPPQITTKGTTLIKTFITTTKSVEVTTQNTKLPMVTTRTSKRPQTVATTTKRPQVTTKMSIRTQSTWTTQNMHPVTTKTSRRPSTPTGKEQDIIKTTTKHQDIPSELIRPKTSPVPQPFPSGEPLYSASEHVKQQLNNHQDQQYALVIGVPVGVTIITAVIIAIICLIRRGTNCFKEGEKTCKLSKGLSIVYEEKASSALPPSYDNPVYGKLMKGKSIGKSSTASEKPRRERTMESSTKKSYVSDRIYDEIQSVRLSVHGTMSSTTSGLKSSKGRSVSSKPLPSGNVSRIPMSGYPGMKGAEYYYMSGNFLIKN